MTYRSMLVLLDSTAANAARADIAIALAKDFDAHLIGIAPISSVDTQALQAAAAMYDYVSRSSEEVMAQAVEAAHHFHSRCEAAALHSFEALTDGAPAPLSLAVRSQCADLLILSQPDPASPDYRRLAAELERVLLDCARPMLLIPHARSQPVRVRHALVASDGSRQSVRAMTDALPLLRRADSVVLMHCRSDRDEPRPPEQLACIRQWLAFQGVDAEPREEATRLPIGDALLAAASDMGADLIVAGAYGRSHWAEKLFGGVSTTLLQSMTVPVLMSH
jgi:nucleotide-binding universal stress UspA family protein